jgi:hypothetical protein
MMIRSTLRRTAYCVTLVAITAILVDGPAALADVKEYAAGARVAPLHAGCGAKPSCEAASV